MTEPLQMDESDSELAGRGAYFTERVKYYNEELEKVRAKWRERHGEEINLGTGQTTYSDGQNQFVKATPTKRVDPALVKANVSSEVWARITSLTYDSGKANKELSKELRDKCSVVAGKPKVEFV